MAFVWLTPVSNMEVAYGGEKAHDYDAQIGTVSINRANVECRWSWESAIEFVAVALPQDRLLGLARDEFGSESVELVSSYDRTVDRKALWLAQMLKEELTEPDAPSELYVDSLVTLFGLHLIKNYTATSKGMRRVQGGLSPYRAKKVQEYLRINLARNITVAEIAAVCGLSPGHFIQVFTKTFRQSPHRYLLNLRLATAEKMLAETDLKISEIAYLTGFSSQSHLTTAMRKHKHTTPAQLRQRK
jgi:AraC family transcriptional regulator